LDNRNPAGDRRVFSFFRTLEKIPMIEGGSLTLIFIICLVLAVLAIGAPGLFGG